MGAEGLEKGGRRGCIVEMSQLERIAIFPRSDRTTCLFMFLFILVGLMSPLSFLFIFEIINDQPSPSKVE